LPVFGHPLPVFRIAVLWDGRLVSRYSTIAGNRNDYSNKERNRSMPWKKKAFAFAFCIAASSVHSSALQAEDSREPSRFTYARLYCGADGETHFQDVTAELREMNFAPPAPPIHIGSDLSTSRAFFGGFEAGWGARDLETRLNHPTPAVQFGIVLQGVFSITSTAGETRRLQPGAVFRLEDTAPCKGHITVVGNQPGFLMFVR
jgi:hypothetical protein